MKKKRISKELLSSCFLLEAFLFFVSGFLIQINVTSSLIVLAIALFLGLWIGDQLKALGVQEYKEEGKK